MSKILIVEDNPHLNNAYKLILEKEGHTVAVAFNGEEGLDKLPSEAPDVILLDLLMPKMGGIEFLKRLNSEGKLVKPSGKAAKGDKQPVIIVLSNLNQDEEVQQAMELGAYKYILKADTSPRELAIRVNHLLDRL